VSDLRDLYQEVILDHSRSPRNRGFPENANCSADGHNPLCGDKITVRVVVEDDRVLDVGFEGAGCAISTAAASTMTEAVKGKTRGEVEALFDAYHQLVTGKVDLMDLDFEEMERLAAFAGVAEFPMRVKCATLAWHTLSAAMNDCGDAAPNTVTKTVTTEAQ